NVYVEGAYDLGFGEVYTELMFHRRLSQQTNAQQIFPIVAPEAPCPVNPFNCPGAANVGNFYAPQVNIVSLYTQRQKVDIWRGVVGLRGDFGPLDGWEYDGYVSYSYNHGRYSTTGIDDAKLIAGIGGDWTSSDFSGICPPGSPAGCYALNLFALPTLAAGNFSQADQDYLRLYDTGLTKYTQVIGEFQVTGDLFDLPAGAVGGAFGVAARYDKLNDTPGDAMLSGAFHNLASASGVTRGDDTVLEAYGEIELPLLRDRTFFKDLTANLSGRISDYDSYGTSTTYKTSLNWQIVDQLRFRATYGTSFRAPALFERFLGDQGGFQGQTVVDPCIRYAPPEGGGVANPNIAANCASQGIPGDYAAIGSSSASIVTGGGENLQPEESKAMSLSLIWTPSFADLSVSVDYFEIEVDNQVASQSTAVVGQCYASADFPNNPFCDLFTRDLDPTSTRYLEILEIDASYRNILTQTNRGIDLTVAYGRDIGPGRFGLNGQFTWTLEDTQELFPGRTDDFNNVIGEPAVVGNAQASYRWNNVTLSWSTDFVGRQSNYEYQFGTDISAPSNLTTPQGAPYRGKNHVEPMWYHHLGVAYDGGDWGMTAGVRNIFDEMPPKVSPALLDGGTFTYGKLGTYAFASQYDYIGRQFFMTLRKEF
ncbi:MAG TPA: TonB-dependent receptor, partial [Phenylobacterium sp.]|nr:TonB-dependent receptor [Phenylobacterium sp.]